MAVILAILLLASLSTCRNAEQITAEQLYGEWRKWFGTATTRAFHSFESGTANVYFSDDGTGFYTDAWEDWTTYFTWQVDGNRITMIDDAGERIGELRPDGAVIGIHWHGDVRDWGLFR